MNKILKLILHVVLFVVGYYIGVTLATELGNSSKFTVQKQGELYVAGYDRYESRKRVVVVDSGLAPELLVEPYMCRDVAQVGFDESLQPGHPHGTNLVSIISRDMNYGKYCITMIKLGVEGRGLIGLTEGIEYAVNMNRTYLINLSIQGRTFSLGEFQIIKEGISKQIHFNVAAGNYTLDLDKMCGIYPACYAKVLNPQEREYFKVIGAQARYSNVGEVVDVFLNGEPMGTPAMQGTSQTTALYTNMMVRE